MKGRPNDRGGIDRGPRPITEALDDVVAGFAPRRAGSTPGAGPGGTDKGEPGASSGGRAPSAAVWGTVFARWEELVGPALTRHARPLRLETGVLVVAVDQPPWATQVRALAPGIISRIAERTGEVLERLEVVVRP